MYDDNEEADGPWMLNLTNVMKPPPARIGRIPKLVQFERTYPVKESVAAIVGGFIGIVLGATIGGFHIRTVLFSMLIFGGIALFIVTWQPMPGEPLWRAVLLWVQGARTRAKVKDGDGFRKVGYAIGIAPIPYSWVAKGEKVVLRQRAVPVSPGSYDERGVLIKESNKNVTESPKKRRVDIPVPRRTLDGDSWMDEARNQQLSDANAPHPNPRDILLQRGRGKTQDTDPNKLRDDSPKGSSGRAAFEEARRRRQGQ